MIRPGVRAACTSLRNFGVLLLVVTNQPDIARGTATRDEVDAINQHLTAELGLDAVLVCPHDDADGCDCRKPKPGLLLRAAEQFGVDLGRSVMVGDRDRDIEAGRRAGVTTVWVRSDYPEGVSDRPDHIVDGLVEVVPCSSHRSPSRRTPCDDRRQQALSPLFADGADMASVRKLAADPLIAGFTTNPTLMRNAGVQDYEAFAHEFLETVSDRPISFEVFSDEFADMERQALKIAPWGDNVYVKIPITNTEGVSSLDLVRRLTNAGVQLNITALMTNAQVDATAEALRAARRPSCRCSPGASPTPAASRSRSWWRPWKRCGRCTASS